MVFAVLALSAPPVVAYPHPLITEVLYNVPTRDGDANGDEKRQVTGDEFIELVNPHDKPISLGGYMLRDRNAPDMGQVKFVFPDLVLQPGEVVVVFNGHDQTWKAPAGTSKQTPEAPHPDFHDAYVFTMQTRSSRTAFANGGDYVLLSSPSGQRVQLVHWGKFDEEMPEAILTEDAEARRGSICRATASESLVAHRSLLELDFSPGRFPHEP